MIMLETHNSVPRALRLSLSEQLALEPADIPKLEFSLLPGQRNIALHCVQGKLQEYFSYGSQ